MPVGIKTLALSLNIGILVGFFDETMQIFSERTYSITDVWIDIAGYASFTLLLTLIYVIIKSIKLAVVTTEERRINLAKTRLNQNTK